MDDLFEDSESEEPHHFIVLDSQDTENIPPSWDDRSILKSLPALRIPETQYAELDLTTIPNTPLSAIHNFEVSETHLLNAVRQVGSCNLNSLKLIQNIMDDEDIVILENSSQSSSTSDSSGNLGRSLNQSIIENPKFGKKSEPQDLSKISNEKSLGVKESKDLKETPSMSLSKKNPNEMEFKVLSRKSLFKNYNEEDTESDDKEPNPVVNTPSNLIGSLQFSQESMLVPDTADEMNFIEPSPEHNPTPTIIPDSPSLSISNDSDDDTQDPTMIDNSLKPKESENLFTRNEPVVEDSIKESQNFNLLYLDTQASEMSQVNRKHGSPEEEPMVLEEPKKDAESFRHDDSEISSENESFNLHLSLNTQSESCKDAASQHASFSEKMSISQSPASQKNSEETRFKLILQPNVPSLSEKDKTLEGHLQASTVSGNLPKTLDISQQEVSQRTVVPSQLESLTHEKVAGSQIDKHPPDVVPSPEKSCLDPGSPKYKSSQNRNSDDKPSGSLPLNSLITSPLSLSQKKPSPDPIRLPTQREIITDDSQNRKSQIILPSQQRANPQTTSQIGESQNVLALSQKEDSANNTSQCSVTQSQVGGSQLRAVNLLNPPGFCERDSESLKSRKENSQGIHKKQSQTFSEKSLDMSAYSQKEDSPIAPLDLQENDTSISQGSIHLHGFHKKTIADSSVGSQHAGIVGSQQADSVGSNQAKSVGSQHAGYVGSQQADSVGLQQAKSVGSQHADSVNSQHADSIGSQHADSVGSQHAESVGSQHAESIHPRKAESIHSQQVESMYSQQAKFIDSQQATDLEMPKSKSQPKTLLKDSPNIVVSGIKTDLLEKNKNFQSQKHSHSQPSNSEAFKSHKSNIQDIKQHSSSLDPGLLDSTNVPPVDQHKTADALLDKQPSVAKLSQDFSNTEKSQSVDNKSQEKIVAIPLGSVSDFQPIGSLPGINKKSDSIVLGTFLSQSRRLGFQNETNFASQPLKPTIRSGMSHEDECQTKMDVGKERANEASREPSPPEKIVVTQEEHKELEASLELESESVKILSLPKSQELQQDMLNNEEGKNILITDTPEKMEIEFMAQELPQKPNICYKNSQSSQGSSTVTLSQSQQLVFYSSQMDASQGLNNNPKSVTNPSTDPSNPITLVSNPNADCSEAGTSATKTLTAIKPKRERKISELPSASSTMYPSQSSASQCRRNSSSRVQPQRIIGRDVSKCNPNSAHSSTKTEQSVVGPSNDPYLFVGSQPKIVRATETRKRQRRLKVLSEFTQKRIQKKSLARKKGSLSSRNWTIRKDYKSPVHRVRFEPLRKRSTSMKLLKDDPIFLKVPSYKDIETIFAPKDIKEQVKSSCSSDNNTQPSTSKDQALFNNLQNVLQRKIVEETVVQLVYRKITIETVKNSKVVDSRTIVEKDEPLIIQRNRNEDFKYLNSAKSASPFCSPNSLTSGEYADVSSLSHSDSKTSNSSSFGSLTNTKQSRFEVPMSPLVQDTASQFKKDNLGVPPAEQPVNLRQLQSPGTDDDLLKAPSPITSIYKEARSVYCSTEELHHVNQSCEEGRSYVTEAVLPVGSSMGDPTKSKAAFVQNSDSLFSSAENLNISDTVPPISVAGQESVPGKESQSSVDSLVHDQSITLQLESSKICEIDVRSPSTDQKWPSSQKRKASNFEENLDETSCAGKPPPQKRPRKGSEEQISLQRSKNSEESGSPEISPQDYQKKIKLSSLSPDSNQRKPGIGMKVMAKWKDGYFYPGVTASLEKGGKCQIHFADGDQLWVKINQILRVNYLPQGQSVMVQSKDNFFDSGMIVDHIETDSNSCDSFVYRVEMDDNSTVNCTRQQIILSEDQAAILLSDEEYQMLSGAPSTPQPSGADVSLDNLVDCSRRSGKKVQVSSEKMESKSHKHTKLMRMEPQAMSTPTPKRKLKSQKKDSEHLESFIGAAVSSPKSRKFDRNQNIKKELFDAVKGPIPKQKTLFKGMNFLLTHTEKSQEQKLMDKKMIQEYSSESSNVCFSDVDEPEVPFDKQHLQAQIEASGGTVFDSWSDKFITKKTKSFIISSSYQRTIKYLQGLATGTPCVSYLWIRDCCKQGILCDYKAYMLQAGISLKKKTLIECKLKPRCLDDTGVLVFSTNTDFIRTWSEILTLAGCNVVQKFKKTRDQNHDVEIVITDKTCSAYIKKQAIIYNAPLLSTEWVIQCLIHGQKLCYTGHEKFKFDYEEDEL